MVTICVAWLMRLRHEVGAGMGIAQERMCRFLQVFHDNSSPLTFGSM